MHQAIDMDYQLDDNLEAESGRIFLTGTQALLRLLLSQARRDQRQGLNTAGFVSGCRGSPLGGVDATLWGDKSLLTDAQIRFQPTLHAALEATLLTGHQPW